MALCGSFSAERSDFVRGGELTVQINSCLRARASNGEPVGITATVEMFWGFYGINVDSLNICAEQVGGRRHRSNTRIFGSHVFFAQLAVIMIILKVSRRPRRSRHQEVRILFCLFGQNAKIITL